MSTQSEYLPIIVEHYNKRQEISLQERMTQPNYHLRTLNNWIKSVLIAAFVVPGDRVLDLCGGKGGDLKKWMVSNIGYLLLVDFSEQSIRDAEERYKNLKRGPTKVFPADFLVVDGFSEELPIDDDQRFDIVSCQFSLQYAFETEPRARCAFRNIAAALKPGGVFLGTIPHAVRISEMMEKHQGSFGNSSYQVEYDPKDKTRYYFTLAPSVKQCPEWLVYPDQLKKLGQEVGLELLFLKDFQQYYYENNRKYGLLRRMGLSNGHRDLSTDEWESVGLYQVFAFQKK